MKRTVYECDVCGAITLGQYWFRLGDRELGVHDVGIEELCERCEKEIRSAVWKMKQRNKEGEKP